MIQRVIQKFFLCLFFSAVSPRCIKGDELLCKLCLCQGSHVLLLWNIYRLSRCSFVVESFSVNFAHRPYTALCHSDRLLRFLFILVNECGQRTCSSLKALKKKKTSKIQACFWRPSPNLLLNYGSSGMTFPLLLLIPCFCKFY